MGPAAGEKKRIHARLLAFCKSRKGASAKISKATNGILEVDQIISMRNAGQFTLAQWRAVNAAMDWIEAQEATAGG